MSFPGGVINNGMKNKKLNNKIIDDKLESRNIQRLESYINNRTKIKFKCLIDGYIWKATTDKLLNLNRGCPLCSKHKGGMTLTNEDIDDRLLGKNIKRLDNYINKDTKIRFQCLIDDHVWKATPNTVSRISGCPKCAGNVKYTNSDIDKLLIGTNIKRLDEYINNITSIRFQCLVDGNIWKCQPLNILKTNNPTGCPACKNKNEHRVKLLIENNVKTQYLKHHKTLSFNNRRYIVDFYLVKDGKEIVIERNGKQHYEPIDYFGGKSAFEKQKSRDIELKSYCLENYIKLVEIPYWLKEPDIIDILKSL